MHDVLIVGVGSIGERHLRCFQATGRARVSLCDMNAGLRQSVAERYCVDRAFENFERALESQPEIAVICTPANLHVSMALQVLRFGKHVLIEKPLSTGQQDPTPLDYERRTRNVIVGVAYVYRCHPALAAMRDAIQSGRVGTPVQLVATCGQHFPLYRPAYRTIYYKDRATGGGAVQDALTHIINAAEWLVGPVTRLAADAGHKVLDGVSVEDTVHVITRHSDSEIMGAFSLNQHQAPNEVTITVIGTGGTVRFEYHANRLRWMTQPGGTWIDAPFEALGRDTLFVRQAHTFLDAVEGKAEPLCTLDEARQTLAVNLAILRAAEHGTWESIH